MCNILWSQKQHKQDLKPSITESTTADNRRPTTAWGHLDLKDRQTTWSATPYRWQTFCTVCWISSASGPVNWSPAAINASRSFDDSWNSICSFWVKNNNNHNIHKVSVYMLHFINYHIHVLSTLITQWLGPKNVHKILWGMRMAAGWMHFQISIQQWQSTE